MGDAKNRKRWTGWGLLPALLLITAFSSFCRQDAEREREPVDWGVPEEELPPEFRDEENVYYHLNEALKLYCKIREEIEPIGEYGQLRGHMHQLITGEEQVENAGGLVRKFKPVFKELEEAADAPSFQRTEEAPMGGRMIVFLTDFTRLLQVKGKYLETKGKYDKALDVYLDMIRMGSRFGPNEILFHWFYEEFGVLSVIEFLNGNRDVDSLLLQRLLSELWVYERRRAGILEWIDHSCGYYLKKAESIEEFNRMKEGLEKGFSRAPYPERLKQDLETRLSRDSFARQLSGACPKMRTLFARPYNDINSMEPLSELDIEEHSVIEHLFYPILHKHASLRDTVYLTNRRAARIVTGLALYRERNGSLPPKLDALTPGILEDVPSDPFSVGGDKPFTYVPAGDKYLLYSIGPDLTDDLGERKFPLRKQFELRKGDIIYSY